MRQPGPKRERGVTIIEVIFSIAIFSLVAVAAAEHIGLSWSYTEMNRDRIFAYRRAQAILTELQAVVDRGDAEVASDLDAYDDGALSRAELSITTIGGKLVDPAHPASLNSQTANGRWRWSRQVSVRTFPGQQTRDVRLVTVRVFRHHKDGRRTRAAEMSSVIRTLGKSYPTTQVYDVYLLALESVPGWWVYMDSIRPFVESTLSDLEARNPGLEFRTHWITKSGYGRDPHYAPYMNDATPSTDPIPGVYFYPGRMPDGSSARRYYVPDNVEGVKNVDGTYTNHVSDNPFPYTVADQFNHCMRLPEARRLFQQRVAVGLEDPQAPTWQLLLEDLISNPTKYHNAILVNLHGELLPMPPMRNYSDAAKDPGNAPGVRAVTHPEQLRYDNGTPEDVRLRVYTYRAAGTPSTLARTDVTVRIGGLSLPDALTLQTQMSNPDPTQRPIRIEKIEAALPAVGAPALYRRITTAPGQAPNALLGESMWVDTVAIEDGDVVLRLKASPTTSGLVGATGLDASARLYGQEYVPSPIGADFTRDLTTIGTGPKNTARWVITIKGAAGAHPTLLPATDAMLEVETHLGTTPGNRYPRLAKFESVAPPVFGDPAWERMPSIDPATAANWSAGFEWQPEKDPAKRWPLAKPSWFDRPENQTTSFVYWTADPASVPFTERYQYVGDPRHCPYADVRPGGANFPNGINWYFDDLNDGAGNYQSAWGFPSGRLRDSWNGVALDVARYTQTVRSAIANAEMLYTTLTGFSYYYLGIGGEIGYDSANGFANSIPVDGAPYGVAGDINVDSISSGGDSNYRGVKLVRATGANYWWCRPWLGELHPDSEHTTWTSTGNLPAGSGIGEFYRARRQDITTNLPTGTSLAAAHRRTGSTGCTSVFNIGTNSSTFHHQFRSNQTGSLTTTGRELADGYNFSMPTTAKISRPFAIATDRDGGLPPEFGFTTDFPRYSAAVVRTYFGHQSAGSTGSALVSLTEPVAGNTGYVVVNGLDRTVESGSAFIAKYSVLSLIHSLLEAGHGGLARPVTRLPRAVITAPTFSTELLDPTSISIQWSTQWVRWDGRPYSATSTPNASESETRLRYSILYSDDNAETWRSMIDDTVLVPGVRPPAAQLLTDQGTGDEVFDWITPGAKFKQGSYLIRIEVYRSTEVLHFAHHTEKIYIDRGQ